MRKQYKKGLAFLIACSLIGTDMLSFGSFGGMKKAAADEVQAQKVVEISEDADASQKAGLNGVLVEDSKDSNIFYNASSEMQDFRDETIYFVMTTRFYDGDPSNNVECWDGKGFNNGECPWRGDFKGLIDKLDYIKALGFTAIWITPVVKNASGYDYHGYHALNFKEVDSRYESDGCTYQDLIDAVHDKGMKIIQDVVFNHTGNFGEENLLPLFSRDDDADLAEITECMIPNPTYFPENYFGLEPGLQYGMRLDYMKNHLKLDGVEKDADNLWHHFGDFNWDDYTCQLAQIAGDCVDLNTENPKVYKYLVDAYTKYINMGVDAFRVDTVRHMSRLSLNKGFISQLNDAYNKAHGTTGERNFYMFGEVCTRYSSVWYREVPALSTPFYTWKESKEYAWNDNENDPEAYITNMASAQQHYDDNGDAGAIKEQPISDNAFLKGNEYHTPDYSMSSGLDVIDFPMHWNFKEAQWAYNTAVSSDKYYNDATYNVVYVDSHDYAPDHAPEDQRYAGSTEQWAENLSLMFTFRGIPCIYYGSEVEFQKGQTIDKGPNMDINETGRAYFGDLIEGSVDVVDFARYTNATGTIADTLNYPLSLHIQRLNRIRAAIPALRKGQYSTEGCTGTMAYKRRYTDATTDSFALVALTSDATFTGIPNGKYTDAVTGDVKTVTDGTLATSGISGKGDLRVYVLDTELTKAPGQIDGKSDYMTGGKEFTVETVAATSVTLDKNSAKLDLGDTVALKSTVLPANATNKTVTWTSSDTSVATVGVNGLVTAKGEGTAKIYAAIGSASKDDFTNETEKVAVATITVEATGVKVTSLALTESALEMTVGEAVTVGSTVLPPNADSRYTSVSWTSSDTSIARVNKNGTIQAVKIGKATITATTKGGVSATVEVEVKGATIYGNAIYFEKPEGWGDKINVYMWTTDKTYSNAAWPGEAMQVIDGDKGIYGYKWPEGVTDVNVIFNDGGNQTKDLVAVMNGYFKDGTCIEEVTTIPESESPSPRPTTSKKDETIKKDETTKQDETSSSKKDETTKIEDTTTSSKQEDTTKIEDTTTSSKQEDTTKIEDATTSVKQEDTTKIEDATTSAKEDDTTKAEEVTTAKEEITTASKEDETTKVEEATTTKEEVTTKVEEATTAKEEVTTAKEEATTAKEEVTTKPEIETTKKEEETTSKKSELYISSFTANKGSGLVEKGSQIKLKAKTSGSLGSVKYKFVVKYNGKESKICNYSSKNYVNFKLAKAGNYTFTVYAKDSQKIVKERIENYTVNNKFKISSFKASVSSGKAKVGKKIKLTAKATGGTKMYQYKFSYKLGSKTTKTNYISKNYVNFKPTKKGKYKLTVYIKNVGTSKVLKKTINYKVSE